MQATITSVIADLFPKSFRKVEMFEPFCKQIAASAALRLQEDLNKAKDDQGNLDEEDKRGVVGDFLHELYGEMLNFADNVGEEDDFIQSYSQDIEETEIPKETIVIPSYRRVKGKKAKGKGKKPAPSDKDQKAINPKTGSKVSMTGTARVFKTLVKEELLTEEGKFTKEGQRVHDEMQAKKPKKVSHPTRKGGKINLNGDAYKKLLSEGWSFNEETETWTEEGDDLEKTEDMENEAQEEADEAQEEPQEEADEAQEEPQEEADAQSPEGSEGSSKVKIPEEGSSKVKIPHPTRKGATLVYDGRGHNKYLDQGWSYNEETCEWTKPENDAENDE